MIFFFVDNENTAPFSVVWDTFKNHSRSTLISRIAKLKSTSETALAQAIVDLSFAEKAIVEEPSTTCATYHSQITNQNS